MSAQGALEGATVQLLGADGSLLGTATAGASGSYSFRLEAIPASGYRLRVDAGAGNAALDLPLTATYGPSDSASSANVTLVTTLVDLMGAAEASAGPLAARDEALALAVGIGMLQRSTWSSPSASTVNWGQLDLGAATEGARQFLARLAADALDGTLSASHLAYFPKAHAGILDVALGAQSGNSLVAGQATTARLQVQSMNAEPVGGYGFTLETGPSWITLGLDGTLTLAPPETSDAGAVAFVVTATDPVAGRGRSVELGLRLLRATPAAAGTVGEGATVVGLPGGEFAVTVPAGAAAPGTSVSVETFSDSQGAAGFTVRTDGAVQELTIAFAEPGQVEPAAVAGSSSSRAAIAAASTVTGAPGVIWFSRAKLFQTLSCIDPSVGLMSYPEGPATQRLSESAHRSGFIRIESPCDAVTPKIRYDLLVASQLLGAVPLGSTDLLSRPPVIFVHGYTKGGGLGGGEGTWRRFPDRLYDLGFLPFEFRWDTRARFEDVAEDLRGAIDMVVAATGKRPHVVAHSFGGLLARTYLQHLADTSTPGYPINVASLTSLGTPHSGIEPSPASVLGVDLPDGQDLLAMDFCSDISCYEAGVVIWYGWYQLPRAGPSLTRELKLDFSLGDDPGEIPAKLSKTDVNPLPADVPIQVLIGMWTDPLGEIREGDTLIAFRGQRFLPDLGVGPLLEAGTGRVPTVRERVLGRHVPVTGATGGLIPGNRVELSDRGPLAIPIPPEGYVHARTSLAVHLASDAPVQATVRTMIETEVECPALPCTHDAFVKTASFLSEVGNPPAGGVDTTPPQPPAMVAATPLSATAVLVQWTASSDPSGIAQYVVHRNGTKAFTVTGVSRADSGLPSPATEYCYQVSAVDTAGNASPLSPISRQACATTSADAIVVTPASLTLPPRATHTFTAAGGAGRGYSWTLEANASGGSMSSTGSYQAGRIGSVTDVVRVSDPSGHTSRASIEVAPAITVTPAQATVLAGKSVAFAFTGGSGIASSWYFTVKASGGAISGTGVYTAGSRGGVTDTIQVMDTLGNYGTATIAVVGVPDALQSLAAASTFAARVAMPTGTAWDLQAIQADPSYAASTLSGGFLVMTGRQFSDYQAASYTSSGAVYRPLTIPAGIGLQFAIGSDNTIWVFTDAPLPDAFMPLYGFVSTVSESPWHMIYPSAFTELTSLDVDRIWDAGVHLGTEWDDRYFTLGQLGMALYRELRAKALVSNGLADADIFLGSRVNVLNNTSRTVALLTAMDLCDCLGGFTNSLASAIAAWWPPYPNACSGVNRTGVWGFDLSFANQGANWYASNLVSGDNSTWQRILWDGVAQVEHAGYGWGQVYTASPGLLPSRVELRQENAWSSNTAVFTLVVEADQIDLANVTESPAVGTTPQPVIRYLAPGWN